MNSLTEVACHGATPEDDLMRLERADLMPVLAAGQGAGTEAPGD